MRRFDILVGLASFATFAAVALVAPRNAQAGIGTTYYVTPSTFSMKARADVMIIGIGESPEMYPSLDLYKNDILIQLHVLRLVAGLADETISVGANGYMTTSHPEAGHLEGLIAPGASLDLESDMKFKHNHFDLAALLRIGVQSRNKLSAGVYVVPELGIALDNERVDLLAGGTLQLSLWLP
jgi:hypothetical protein